MPRRVEHRRPGAAGVEEIAPALVGDEPERALRRIAESASALANADGAFVELIDGDTEQVETVLASGWGAPPSNTRLSYSDSLAREVIERGEPELVDVPAEMKGPEVWPLEASCAPCRALVVPLASGDQALGALVLLRRPERAAFSAEEVGRIRVLADLTAVALLKTMMLRRSERSRRELVEREERFREIAESIQEIFWIYDPSSHRTLYVSPRYEALFGRPPESVYVHPLSFLEKIHPGDRAAVEKAIAGMERGEYDITYRLAGPSGEIRFIHARAFPVRGRGGAIERMVGIAEDVTEQKRLDEALRRQVAQVTALQDATLAISASLSTEDIVRRIAESALQATGADGAYVARKEGADLVAKAVAGYLAPPLGSRSPFEGSFAQQQMRTGEPLLLRRLADGGRPLPGGLERTHPDASAVLIPLSGFAQEFGGMALLRSPAKPLFTEEEVHSARTFGRLAAIAFRRARLLQELQAERDELQQILASRERLIRGFSHDVKNPLGAADGYAQLLEEGVVGALTEEQRDSIVRLRRSLHAALRLIGDLLDLARAEAGRLGVERKPVDLREISREMAVEYEAAAESAGLTLSLEMPSEFPAIRSDDARIRQILGNLLSNAVKYTPSGGRTGVRLSRRTGAGAPGPGEWAAVDVWDTGPGIPAERQSTIFQEFARVEPARTRGVGLGLAISRLLARALGGELSMSSAAGQGATFTLWLPLHPA